MRNLHGSFVLTTVRCAIRMVCRGGDILAKRYNNKSSGGIVKAIKKLSKAVVCMCKAISKTIKENNQRRDAERLVRQLNQNDDSEDFWSIPIKEETNRRKGHGGKCTGDCKNCPPHYGYRYGRWYYGHCHIYGCEFGGNKGDGSMD